LSATGIKTWLEIIFPQIEAVKPNQMIGWHHVEIKKSENKYFPCFVQFDTHKQSK